MATGNCAVCFGEQRSGKPLLQCCKCKRDCHISCTVSKCRTEKARCLDCDKTRPVTKRERERATSTLASTNKARSSTSRSSPSSAAKISPASAKKIVPSATGAVNTTAAAAPTERVAPSATVAHHRPTSEKELTDSAALSTSPAAHGAADTSRTSVQRVEAPQASRAATESKINISSLNVSLNESYFKSLNTSSIINKEIASTVVEHSSNTYKAIDRMFNELKNSTDGKLDKIHKAVAILPAMNELLSKYAAKLSSVEGLVQAQSSKLEELLSENKSLINANHALENRIKVLEEEISTMMDARTPLESDKTEVDGGGGSCARYPLLSSCVSRPDVATGARPTIHTEDSEVIVSGLLSSDAPHGIHNDVAFAVLGTLLPSLEKKDIVEVRTLGSRGAAGRTEELSEDGESARSKNLSLKVKVASREITESLMRARRKFNYFNKNDLNSSLITPETLTHVTDKRIYVNLYQLIFIRTSSVQS